MNGPTEELQITNPLFPTCRSTRWLMLVCDLVKIKTPSLDKQGNIVQGLFYETWVLNPSGIRIYRAASFILGFIVAVIAILMMVSVMKLPGKITFGEITFFCLTMFGNVVGAQILHVNQKNPRTSVYTRYAARNGTQNTDTAGK